MTEKGRRALVSSPPDHVALRTSAPEPLGPFLTRNPKLENDLFNKALIWHKSTTYDHYPQKLDTPPAVMPELLRLLQVVPEPSKI